MTPKLLNHVAFLTPSWAI